MKCYQNRVITTTRFILYANRNTGFNRYCGEGKWRISMFSFVCILCLQVQHDRFSSSAVFESGSNPQNRLVNNSIIQVFDLMFGDRSE